MALRIVETAHGPILIDDELAGPTFEPTRLEALAEEVGLGAEELRVQLRDEIQRRRRAGERARARVPAKSTNARERLR